MADIKIAINRLRPGIYVKLPLPWDQHPFMRSKFKIAHATELNMLNNLGLEYVLIDPAKSDVPPLPPPPRLITELEHPHQVESSRLTKEAEIQAKWQLLNNQQRYEASMKRAVSSYHDSLKQVAPIFSSPIPYAELNRYADQLIDRYWTRLAKAKDHMIHLISMEEIDNEVSAHSLNVTALSMLLAKAAERSDYEICLLGRAALFHDIGQLAAPSREIQDHARQSCQVLQKAGVNDQQLMNIILQHHEYLDGTGLPSGLIEEQIHPLAQLLAVVNQFDSLCHQQLGVSPHSALMALSVHYKDRLNPRYIALLNQQLGIYPPGTFLKLTNQMIVLVVAVNHRAMLYPFVEIKDIDEQRSVINLADLNTEVMGIIQGDELQKMNHNWHRTQRLQFMAKPFDSNTLKEEAPISK